jgi:hypothetical protein
LVINLAFLVPYRFELERARGTRWWLVPIMLIAGFAAGLCNEHTGPAIAGLAIAATVAAWLRDRRPSPWAIAGIVGIIAGGIALFYAPGQDVRYNALATHGGMLSRIIDRGAVADLGVVAKLFAYLAPALVWVALAVVVRLRRRGEPAPSSPHTAQLALVAGAIAIALTLLASPKIGPRLYFGSVALACTAIASAVVSELVTRWSRAIAAAMAVAVFVFAGWRCIGAYHELGPEFANRLAALSTAPHDSVLDLPRYTLKRTRWNLDDDLEIPQIRNMVAYSFSLALIRMTGTPPGEPPPTTDP